MTKHKTEDYKISAVKYYLNNDKGDGYKKTCKIFDCKKSTLRDWIKRYNTSKNLTRKNRKPISYKITKPQVKTALELLKKNEQLTMNELAFDMKQKYPTFDIEVPDEHCYILESGIISHNSSSAVCGSVSQGIEPIYKNAYIQNTASGKVNRINPSLLNLMKEKNVYSDEVVSDIIKNNGSVQHVDWLTDDEKLVFKTAFEITISCHLPII